MAPLFLTFLSDSVSYCFLSHVYENILFISNEELTLFSEHIVYEDLCMIPSVTIILNNPA